MGRVIRPDEIREQAAAVTRALEEDNQELEAVLREIEVHIRHRGEADTQIRFHRTILRGMLCVNDMVIKAHEEMVREAGTEDLVENDLLQDMDCQQKMIDEYQKRYEMYDQYMEVISASATGEDARRMIGYVCDQKKNCVQMARISRLIRQKLQEKADRISEIERRTNKLYDEADFLYEYIEQGLQAIGQEEMEQGGENRWEEMLQRAWQRREEQALT